MFNTGVQLKFLIYDDLQIEIEPRQSMIETVGTKLPLMFEIRLNNFKFCETECSFTLSDTFNGKVISNESFILLKNKNFMKNYSIDLSIKGNGQNLIYFETKCKNIRSFLCRTDEQIKSRYALVTINKNYNLIETSNLKFARENLEKVHYYLNKAEYFRNLSKYTVNLINNKIPLNFDLRKNLEYAFELFNESLKVFYNQEFSDSVNLLKQIENLSNYELNFIELNLTLSKYNQNIEYLQIFSSESFSDVYNFYLKEEPEKSGEIKSLYQTLKILNLSTFESIVSLEPSLILNSFFVNYSFDLNVTEFEFNEDLRAQYNLLSGLNSFNLTGDLCQNAIILQNKTEFHNSNLKINNSENFSKIIEFINNSLFIVTQNKTHLIIGNSSLLNVVGLNLSEYFRYILLPNLSPNFCNKTKGFEFNSLTNYTKILLNLTKFKYNSIEISEPIRKCCIFGECSECSIKQDNYPVVFIHGHSMNKNDLPESSIDAFFEIQKKLSEEGVIINVGDIDYTSTGEWYWSEMSIPVGVSATFYYALYYDANSLVENIMKEEGIESYSIRLKEVIDTVRLQTGVNKVRIVAHSMGGLVVQNYLMLFGEDKVESVILIATPNKGVAGKIESFCGYLGDKKACRDMKLDSVFLKRLERFKPEIPFNVIIGKGCDTGGFDGDGVVQISSAELEYANLTYVMGSCNDALKISLHNDLLNPIKYPEVYERIKTILMN